VAGPAPARPCPVTAGLRRDDRADRPRTIAALPGAPMLALACGRRAGRRPPPGHPSGPEAVAAQLGRARRAQRWCRPRPPAGASVHGLVMPSSGSRRVASRALRRRAAAMLRWRRARRIPMARLRRLAVARGAVPVRTWEASSAKVVQRLDAPVTPDPVGEAGRACPGGGEAGDRLYRHGPPARLVEQADPAGDPQRLGGVGEVQPGHGGDLQAAGLGTAVARGGGQCRRRGCGARAGVVAGGAGWAGRP
jgi:hypothetical protein